MLWKSPHSWVPELNRNAQNLYTDVTINFRVGEKLEQFLSTSGVKQGDNLAPSSLSLSSTQYPTLSTRNGISQPLTLDGFRTLKLEASREDNYAEPIPQGHNVLVLQVLLCRRYGLHSSQPRGDRRLKLIVSHFRRFGLTIHTGSEKRRRLETEAIHFPRPGQESSAADMEDIEIDADRFMSFASSSNT
jgi:hypothetical protein